MKVITQKEIIDSVVSRWERQYHGVMDRRGLQKRETFGQTLEKLKKAETKEEIDSIIGNDSWTEKIRCNECDRKFEKVIRLGEEPDWEISTANICLACLKKAIKILEGE